MPVRRLLRHLGSSCHSQVQTEDRPRLFPVACLQLFLGCHHCRGCRCLGCLGYLGCQDCLLPNRGSTAALMARLMGLLMRQEGGGRRCRVSRMGLRRSSGGEIFGLRDRFRRAGEASGLQGSGVIGVSKGFSYLEVGKVVSVLAQSFMFHLTRYHNHINSTSLVFVQSVVVGTMIFQTAL